ncbi:MAG: flagellar export chaperone FliS [Gemmatimonadota bacterium]
MTYAAQTARYVENDVLTRSPEWIVPLLYDHLLSSLRRAVVQIEAKDLDGRAESLGKASAIVGELLGSLDRENGGEIAEGLASLYTYFALELLNVGRSREIGALPSLIEMVEELHTAWVTAAQAVAPRPTQRPTQPALAASAA